MIYYHLHKKGAFSCTQNIILFSRFLFKCIFGCHATGTPPSWRNFSDAEPLKRLGKGENRTKGRHVTSLMFEELTLGDVSLS